MKTSSKRSTKARKGRSQTKAKKTATTRSKSKTSTTASRARPSASAQRRVRTSARARKASPKKVSAKDLEADRLRRAIEYCNLLANRFRHNEAATAAGIQWAEFRLLVCKNEELATLYQEAQEIRRMGVAEQVQDNIERRALEGWDEPIYQGGKQVGYRRRFSDRCMEMLAKSVSPEKFSEQILVKSHVSGPGGGPIAFAVAPPAFQTPAEWEEWANGQLNRDPHQS